MSSHHEACNVEELLSAVFHSRAARRCHLRQMLWSRRKGILPMTSGTRVSGWQAQGIAARGNVPCQGHILQRKAETNGILFLLCLASTAKLCVNSSPGHAQLQETPPAVGGSSGSRAPFPHLPQARGVWRQAWSPSSSPRRPQGLWQLPCGCRRPAEHSPSQGLTATAAVLPATQPERKDT